MKSRWALRPATFHQVLLEENCTGPSAQRLYSKTVTFLNQWYETETRELAGAQCNANSCTSAVSPRTNCNFTLFKGH